MNLFSLIVIVAGLSLETFGVIYLNGFLREKETSLANKSRVVFYVTLANVVMAALGFFTGQMLSSILSEFATGLSTGILFIIGLKLIIKSFKPKFREMTWELTNQKVLLAFSFAVGINMFLLGLALPGFGVEILNFMVTVAVVYFFSSLLGLIFGSQSSNFLLASRLMLAGGVVVAGNSIYIILQRFNLI